MDFRRQMQIQSFTTNRILVFALLAIVVSLLVGIPFGDVSLGFQESNVGTFASVAILLLTAYASLKIHALRNPQRDGRLLDPAHIWAIIGAGFIFLGLDDALRLHEQMDRLIHQFGGVEETAVSDRLDDLIILAYGLVGIVVLFAYRREIVRVEGFVPLLAIGFVLMFLQVAVDVITNRDEYLELLDIARENARSVKRWMHVLEESLKLLAEAFFFAGFVHVLRHDLAEAGK